MSYRLSTLGVIRLADSMLVTPDKQAWQEYRAWLKAGNVPEAMPAPVVPPTSLAEAKATKIRKIRAEAMVRVNVHLPDATDVSTLILLRELYLSIAPAARQPTAAMSGLINIYQAMQSATDAVRACSTTGCVDAVTPAWP